MILKGDCCEVMKKIWSLLLCVLFILPLLIACESNTPAPTDTKKINGLDSGSIGVDTAEVMTSDAGKIQSLRIAGTNIADYTILQPETASECLNFAASELAAYIEKACGAKLEIAAAATDNHVIELIVDTDGEWEEEAFTIQTENGRLTITGGSERACLYGVYEFLEGYIGWRFLTADCETLLPESENIDIPDNINEKQSPVFSSRGIWTGPAYYEHITGSGLDLQQDYWAKRHLNREDHLLTDKHGGGRVWSHGNTSRAIAYYLNEPEEGAVCLTDESIYQRVLASVYNWLATDTKPAELLSICQNDNMAACNCENCTKVYQEEGSDSGTLVRFINRIAEAIEEDYPDLTVVTLAYMRTEKPPKVTKMRDNVAIQYCTHFACYQHAINDPECDEYGGLWGYYFNNTARAADLVEWGKICKTLYVWEYGSFFSNYYAYFPTLDVLRENCKFYAENNVKEVFLNGTWEDKAEFDELRTYLHAKVYWDPYMTDDEYSACIDDFMRGYYGDAWKEIRAYYDFLEESSNKSDYCFCDANYTTFRLFRRMDVVIKEQEVTELFEKAKAAVKADSVLLRRVEDIELTWQCALLSCRYMADYVYGSEAVRAEYQEKTKALYDKCAERGFPSDIGHEGGESPLPPYNPDQYPYQWFNADEEKRIVGNQYV